MDKKCKHDFGWTAINGTQIFVFEDGKVSFNFGNHSRKQEKVKFECNQGCGAIRNIYFNITVEKYGEIRRSHTPDPAFKSGGRERGMTTDDGRGNI